MYGQLTRAQCRDQSRRELDIIPPIDDGTGVAGAQPLRWPYPTNASLDIWIDAALEWFNNKCGMSGDSFPRQLPIPAQTALGPLALTLQAIAPRGSVANVRSVAWVPTGSNPIPLTPSSQETLDRDRVTWQNTSPSTPQKRWVNSGTLLIWPAPSSAGVLDIMFGTSFWTQAATVDNEIPEIIPAAFFPLVIAKVCEFVCLARAGDPVMVARGKGFMQRVMMGLPDMISNFAHQDVQEQGGLIPRTGRMTYGRGRR